jgi:hypothetical protein
MVLPVCILNPSFRDGVDEHGPDNLLGFGNDFLIFLGEELQIFPCHYISWLLGWVFQNQPLCITDEFII